MYARQIVRVCCAMSMGRWFMPSENNATKPTTTTIIKGKSTFQCMYEWTVSALHLNSSNGVRVYTVLLHHSFRHIWLQQQRQQLQYSRCCCCWCCYSFLSLHFQWSHSNTQNFTRMRLPLFFQFGFCLSPFHSIPFHAMPCTLWVLCICFYCNHCMLKPYTHTRTRLLMRI